MVSCSVVGPSLKLLKSDLISTGVNECVVLSPKIFDLIYADLLTQLCLDHIVTENMSGSRGEAIFSKFILCQSLSWQYLLASPDFCPLLLARSLGCCRKAVWDSNLIDFIPALTVEQPKGEFYLAFTFFLF
jgi:hypothetical protein